MKKIILFVCNGNIHRSVIAAEILKKILKKHRLNIKFSVDSYGTQGTKGTRLPQFKHLSEYPKEWKVVKPILQKFDIDISKHSFQKISLSAVKKASVVIAMDNKVYSTARNSLTKQFPNQIYKIHCFSELISSYGTIEDPAGSSDPKKHKKIIKKIYSTLNKKFKNILDWTG